MWPNNTNEQSTSLSKEENIIYSLIYDFNLSGTKITINDLINSTKDHDIDVRGIINDLIAKDLIYREKTNNKDDSYHLLEFREDFLRPFDLLVPYLENFDNLLIFFSEKNSNTFPLIRFEVNKIKLYLGTKKFKPAILVNEKKKLKSVKLERLNYKFNLLQREFHFIAVEVINKNVNIDNFKINIQMLTDICFPTLDFRMIKNVNQQSWDIYEKRRRAYNLNSPHFNFKALLTGLYQNLNLLQNRFKALNYLLESHKNTVIEYQLISCFIALDILAMEYRKSLPPLPKGDEWRILKNAIKSWVDQIPWRNEEPNLNNHVMEFTRMAAEGVFKRCLKKLFEEYNLDVNKAELDEMVTIRNGMVHSGLSLRDTDKINVLIPRLRSLLREIFINKYPAAVENNDLHEYPLNATNRLINLYCQGLAINLSENSGKLKEYVINKERIVLKLYDSIIEAKIFLKSKIESELLNYDKEVDCKLHFLNIQNLEKYIMTFPGIISKGEYRSSEPYWLIKIRFTTSPVVIKQLVA